MANPSPSNCSCSVMGGFSAAPFPFSLSPSGSKRALWENLCCGGHHRRRRHASIPLFLPDDDR